MGEKVTPNNVYEKRNVIRNRKKKYFRKRKK
jgi:hypothetical protein